MTNQRTFNTREQLVHSFMSLFNTAPDPMGIIDLERLDFNLANVKLEQLLNNLQYQHGNFERLFRDEEQLAFKLFVEELKTNRQATLSSKLTPPHGSSFDVFIRAFCLNDNDVLLHFVDISWEAKKKEEDSQKKWIRYFEHLFANSKDILNLFSLTNQKILRLNPHASEVLGYSREDLEKTPIEKIYPPEELLKLGATFQRLSENGVAEEKLKIYDKKGGLRDIWSRAFVIQYEPETLCLVHTIDITEEKEKERKLLKGTRLAALGEASATLAHEINNSLQSIQFNLYLLKDVRDQLPDIMIKRLKSIENSITHIGTVVRNIQNYTNISRAGKTNVFVSTVVEGALQLLEGYVESRQVKISSMIPKNLPPIHANPNQVQQILLILFKNAIQAMTNSTRKELIFLAEREGQKTVLRVQDSGCGIPDEIKDRVFDALVTTKPIGVGLGLGLSVAKKLADANDIVIEFHSMVEKGTEFVLTFAGQAEESTETIKIPKQNILLYIDDEDSLFPSFEEALQKSNIMTIKAHSAKEGLDILVKNNIDVILCMESMYPISGYGFLKNAIDIFKGPMCLMQGAQKLRSDPDEKEINKLNVSYLKYPCDFEEFFAKVNTLISQTATGIANNEGKRQK